MTIIKPLTVCLKIKIRSTRNNVGFLQVAEQYIYIYIGNFNITLSGLKIVIACVPEHTNVPRL